MNVNPTHQSSARVNMATGTFTTDGTAVTLTLGFVPRVIKVIDVTGAIVWDKIEGLAANAAIKTVAGTVAITVDTSGAITINTDGTVTLAAATFTTGKSCAFVAQG